MTYNKENQNNNNNNTYNNYNINNNNNNDSYKIPKYIPSALFPDQMLPYNEDSPQKTGHFLSFFCLCVCVCVCVCMCVSELCVSAWICLQKKERQQNKQTKQENKHFLCVENGNWKD